MANRWLSAGQATRSSLLIRLRGRQEAEADFKERQVRALRGLPGQQLCFLLSRLLSRPPLERQADCAGSKAGGLIVGQIPGHVVGQDAGQNWAGCQETSRANHGQTAGLKVCQAAGLRVRQSSGFSTWSAWSLALGTPLARLPGKLLGRSKRKKTSSQPGRVLNG